MGGGWLEPRTIPKEGDRESTSVGDKQGDVPGREDRDTDAGGGAEGCRAGGQGWAGRRRELTVQWDRPQWKQGPSRL